MSVLTLRSDVPEMAALAGGKGQSLRLLAEAGFAVPPWAVIGLDVFDEHLRETGLDVRITTALQRVGAGDTGEAEAVADTIRGWIAASELTSATRLAIRDAYREVGEGAVAVRSSGADEDGPKHSFAGQFTTVLNVTSLAQVIDAVRECWASAFSARSLHYRLGHGLPPTSARVAVILQTMVVADKSGVLFTANPMTGTRGERVISAVFGLGEGLVSGAVDADTVVLDATNTVLDTVVGDKQERFDADPAAAGCRVTETAQGHLEVALSDAEISALGDLAGRVEHLCRAPQDVEWAIDNAGTLWVLQSRPITTLPDEPAGELGDPRRPDSELRIWDNSNIIESFRDITSPLTYSFARRVYQEVYAEYARTLKVPAEQQQQMQSWLPHLLGYFHGHVYYNLLNWYRLVRLSPLYGIGKQSLEISLGVEESLDAELAEQQHPYTCSSRGQAVRVTIRTRIAYFWQFLRVERTVKNFLRYFNRRQPAFDGIEYHLLPADQVFQRYQTLERTLVAKWGRVAILDSVIGISFGVLNVLTKRWLPDAPAWFGWAVSSPGTAIESIEPAHRIVQLARQVLEDPAMESVVRDTEPTEVYEALAAKGYRQFLDEVDAYISTYGYRSLDELKLEVPDLREDPAAFFVLLRNALAENAVHRDGGHDADEYLHQNLSWPRRWVYERIRGKVRRSLAARENLRFCRTRAFGTAKKMMRAIGTDLARSGALNSPTDVYYLSIDEIRGCFEATVIDPDLKSLVTARRAQETANREMTAPSRFTTRGAVHWLANLDDAGWRGLGKGTRDSAAPQTLSGIAASPGTARARALVVDAPGDVNGDILVTYRTDPGWVAALPSAAGLLIERGSPLTHVAIVARELGVPTVVQIKQLTHHVETGMHLYMDGGTGQIQILPDEVASTDHPST
ncbi:phosphoenolpyruvate synthase [Plantactinospora sp. S1510]|uniref:Phosphoenolpyruvate synthase n=1 Tax=Plantactinospora alkalitolerans TaxID=2789879 RepID=A0ABS0GUP3_9ACTN|nr:phosphoenolpyruvate synthase [Plantactinospora alkalitolerans]MBF9129926.1 phosphoenolpyruvate synthase [Plantactinospora alkalitolerans]